MIWQGDLNGGRERNKAIPQGYAEPIAPDCFVAFA